MKEHDLYAMLADYLRYNYKDIIWRFDLAADLKLTIGQARKHKRLQQHRGYPDLFIAEPRGVKASCKVVMPEDSVIKEAQFIEQKHGLYLEIKKAGTRIFKKDGKLVADEHIREQFDMLEQLRRKGYVAEFACGFDEAKEIIDNYLGRPYANEEIF